MFNSRDSDSNNSYLINSGNKKIRQRNSLPNDSDFIDTSRSNSIDSGKGYEFSTPSMSGKVSLSGDSCDRKESVSSSRSTPVDPGYLGSNYLYTTKRMSFDVTDSGISSPTYLMLDTIDSIAKQRRGSSKTEAEFNKMELLAGDQIRSGGYNFKCQLHPSKPISSGFQSSVGIGNIVSRIRSLSISVSNSRRKSVENYALKRDSVSSAYIATTCMPPNQYPDPTKLPKQNKSTVSNFDERQNLTNKNWIRMTHSLSCDVESFNLIQVPSKNPKGRYRSSEEAVYVAGDTPKYSAMNRLERFLSGHIDTSTPNGALLAVINQGLRKVSESDRYLLFSKSPLRSPVDFLDSGIEHLGDSDILITVLHHSTCYDLMPESGKVIIIDSTLAIKKAFDAIEDNNVNCAPIWCNEEQSFIGVLSKDNQMYLLLLAYQFREKSGDIDTYMERISRESLSNCIGREPARHQLQWANPESTLCSIIKRLDASSSSQVLIIDEQWSGNALYVLDHRRILTFLLSASQYGLPLPSVLKTTVGVTELMMSRSTLQRYKVYLNTDLTTLLKVMDGNPHHCAIVCLGKSACKSCLCTDECVGLLTVDDVSLLIAQSSHCDPSYKVESILNQVAEGKKTIVYCDEREPVINVIKSIIQEKVPFILINQDCCKTCIHSIVSSKELLNYIMRHDKCSGERESTYIPEKRKSNRSFSCCEETQKISDMNLIYETDEAIVPPTEYA